MKGETVFDTVGFFEGLSLVGWFGILIWVGFVALMIFKGRIFTSYDERFPRFDFIDSFLYEDWHYWLFMVVRFLLIVLILFVVTKIMFLI